MALARCREVILFSSGFGLWHGRRHVVDDLSGLALLGLELLRLDASLAHLLQCHGQALQGPRCASGNATGADEGAAICECGGAFARPACCCQAAQLSAQLRNVGLGGSRVATIHAKGPQALP